jgi:hypothetical protein
MRTIDKRCKICYNRLMEQNPSGEPRHISESIEQAAESLADMPVPKTREELELRDSKETIADLENEKKEIEQRIKSGDATLEDMQRYDNVRIDLIAERGRSGGIQQTDG